MKSATFYGICIINNNFYFVDLASLPYDHAYIHIDVECNVYRRVVYSYHLEILAGLQFDNMPESNA